MMKPILFALLITLGFSCCGSTAPNAEKKADKAAQGEAKLAPIAKVTPPITISDPQAQAEWVVANYWNLFNFSDTIYIESTELEQSFVDWIVIMPYITNSSARQTAFTIAFNKAIQADRLMFDEFLRLSEHYLYDPNSPMRNEGVYIDGLRAQLSIGTLADIEKIRPQAQLNLALKNRVGTKATDISYQTIDGKKGKVSSLKGREFLVLFFNNPDCHNCKEVREQLSSNPAVLDLERQGRLQVVALYPDEDRKAWIDYAPNIPENWINAVCDLSIKKDEIYDLRAIPNLYLLDKNNVVVLKDCTAQQLIEHLAAL